MDSSTESKGRGEFFAVDEDALSKAAKTGMNTTVAYLVMACGTGVDNVTTAWSADAVSRYSGISWRRAKKAIDELSRRKVIVSRGETKKPRYKLIKPKRLIWLPNSFVVGAGSETPPLERLRQSGDIEALTLAVRLYKYHELTEDEGLPRTLLYQRYARTHVLNRGQYHIYGFERCEQRYCHYTGPLSAYRETRTAWDHLAILEDAQVIQWVSYLVESDSAHAELIHPLVGDGAANQVAGALAIFEESVTENYPGACGYEWLIPIARHRRAATVIGLARLRYRPRTSMTATWWAQHADTCASFAALYERLSRGDMRVVA